MPEAPPPPATSPIDWESFWLSYRKPGYIAGYEILEKRGGGMFGLVFKARKQSIGKDYAIKFLKVDDQEVRNAVLAELEAVRHFAQVDHPNLVSIEDRGEVDGIPYIVMAYAGSETLRDRLAAPDVDREELVRLFLQACRGVHALHERSLVHFDLKPAHVFIKGSVARVGDYGLSKLVAHSRNTLSMGRGTPYYMAPEMLRRKGDARSDIYSLGVILYECLTGEVPFKGDSEWEVLRKHENQPPSYPEGMPAAHRAVIERCLAKDPAERIASAGALLEALCAPAGARPEAAAPPPPHGHRDPYAEIREAAKDLGQHARRLGHSAREVAVHAFDHASELAERAMGDAQQAMHKAVLKARERRQAREMARVERRERRQANAAARIERGLCRSRQRSWWRPLACVAFFLCLAMCWVVPRSMAVRDRDRAWATVQVTPGPRVTARKARELKAAAAELQREITTWTARLPRSEPALRAFAAASAPEALPEPAVPNEVRQWLDDAIWRLAREQGYDTRLGDELAEYGYAALVRGIAALEELDVGTADGLRAARHLNRLLVDLTGLEVIALSSGEEACESGPARERDQAVPRLWRSFVHDVLEDDPGRYQRYQAIRKR